MAYAPTIDRTTLLQGPAHILFDKVVSKPAWKYIWCNGNVTVSLARTPKEMTVAGFGAIDDPAKDEWIEIDFTPAGNFSSAVFDWMFSGVFALKSGASIFPSTDSPVFIHTLDGKLMEIANARVVQFRPSAGGAGNARFEGTGKIVGVIKRAPPVQPPALFTKKPSPKPSPPSPSQPNGCICHACQLGHSRLRSPS